MICTMMHGSTNIKLTRTTGLLFVIGLSRHLMTVLSVVVNIMKLRNLVVGIRKVVRNLFLCLFDLNVGAIYFLLHGRFQFLRFQKGNW
jgi:hypothetical protein